MTITREQVADLRVGDIVELRDARWPEGSVVRGPLAEGTPAGSLRVCNLYVRYETGQPIGFVNGGDYTLTVVRRAPRPLYVNHDRAQPVAGDVVRDADSDRDPRTWVRNAEGFSHEWMTGRTHAYVPRENLPARLRLLVDGETGLPPAERS